MTPVTALGNKFLHWFDRYSGRWANVWINVGLTLVMGTVAFFISPGWVRDLWWFVTGANAGYAFMWLVSPRFNAARRREMEAEMALIAASTLNHMTREALIGIRNVMKEDEEPGGYGGRLQ